MLTTMTKGEPVMNDEYTTISGDMWDKIAYEQMGSSFYMDKLIKANLEYMDYYIFPAGITLVIPEIEAEEIEDVPPWKRGLLNE